MGPGADPRARQRATGILRATFARTGERTEPQRLFETGGLRWRFPRARGSCEAAIVNVGGGVAGGDALRFDLTLGHAAAVEATTVAAEKIYRSEGPEARIETRLALEAQARLSWLPQETILFDGARLARRTTVATTRESRLLASEMLVFGRTARGESFASGFLHDAWRITRDGKLVWADALTLEGDIATALARPAAFAGARATATVVYVATDAAAHLDTARALLESADSWAAATVVNEILLARFVGRDAASVRRDLIGYLCGLRQAAGGWPAQLPRVWYH